MKMTMKFTVLILLAFGSLGASQIVGVTVLPGQVGNSVFPGGPLNLMVQFQDGSSEVLTGWEYIPTTYVPQTIPWVENDLTLVEAETQGLQASEPNGAFNYEVAAELTLDPPDGVVTQLAIWETMDDTNQIFIPYQTPVNDALAEAEVEAAETVVEAGGLVSSDFVALDPAQNLWEAPAFIVDPVPVGVVTATPEPFADEMIGFGILMITIKLRKSWRKK